MTPILHSKIIGQHTQHFLIFHGLFGQSDNFGTLAKQFSEHFTVHIIDLRNHGRSFHSDDVGFETMANDILNYLEHHQINDCFLLGHSLGGKVVMEFSYKYPERLNKLIVADIAPKDYPPHHQGIIKALNSIDFNTIEKRSQADEILQLYIPEFGVRQFLLKNIYLENGKYAFRFNLKTLTEKYNELIAGNSATGRFDKPTLFLRGDKSNYIMNEDFPFIQSHFPQAEIKTIANAGHWLHAENPKDFFKEVLSFLQS